MKLIGTMYTIPHKKLDMFFDKEVLDNYVEEELAIKLAKEIAKELKDDIKYRLLSEQTEFRLDVVILNREEFKKYVKWKVKTKEIKE